MIVEAYNSPMPIERIVNKFRIGEEPNNSAVWKDYSASERLAALESIRMEYHLTKYGTEPRLQRVLRITQQAPG